MNKKKVVKAWEYCGKCGLPRSAYHLKPEPGFGNPEPSMGICVYGHLWIEHFEEIKEIKK